MPLARDLSSRRPAGADRSRPRGARTQTAQDELARVGRAPQREGARSPPGADAQALDRLYRAEREVIEKEIARVRALPEVATLRQCSHRITDVWPRGTTPTRISRHA